jgi:hypothetical protein
VAAKSGTNLHHRRSQPESISVAVVQQSERLRFSGALVTCIAAGSSSSVNSSSRPAGSQALEPNHRWQQQQMGLPRSEASHEIEGLVARQRQTGRVEEMVATLGRRFCSAQLGGSAPVTTAPEIVIRLRPSEEPQPSGSSGGGSGYSSHFIQRDRKEVDLLPQRSCAIRFLWSWGVDLARPKIVQLPAKSQIRINQHWIGARGESGATVGSIPDRTLDSLHSGPRKRKQLQQIAVIPSAQWRHPAAAAAASAYDQTIPTIAAHQRRERRIGNSHHIETRSGWIPAGLRHRSRRARRRGRQVPTVIPIN